MDILEHGSADDARRPRSRRGRLLLIVVLALAVLGVIVTQDVWRRTPQPAPTPAVADSNLVRVGDDFGWLAENETKNFVLRVDLTNFNRVPVEVLAGVAPEVPGLDGLVVAVMAGDATTTMPDRDAVSAASALPFQLDGNQSAQLAIAARVSCASPLVARDNFTILVDGQRTTVTMPQIHGRGWAAAMARELCPA